MGIRIENISKRFGSFVALDNVTLEAPNGELLALLGPSGSGKTTLLRVIAGLETPDSGTIRCQREDVTRQSVRKRNIGFVFQHYALFRHMNVYENVAFGLRVRKKNATDIDRRVRELLRLVRLESLDRRYPMQLSGGQRQRVALARALAVEPKVLLLDEPFGALDAKVRQELRQWLRRLHDEIQMTSVFVTHDQEEAFEVADRVAVMQRGRVEQVGTPQEVFEKPANRFVIDFLGRVNVFQGRVENGRARWRQFQFDLPPENNREGSPVAVYVRPHELEIERSSSTASGLRGRVERVNTAGPVAKISISAAELGVDLSVELTKERCAELGLARGDTVYVSPRRARVFSPEYVI